MKRKILLLLLLYCLYVNPASSELNNDYLNIILDASSLNESIYIKEGHLEHNLYNFDPDTRYDGRSYLSPSNVILLDASDLSQTHLFMNELNKNYNESVPYYDGVGKYIQYISQHGSHGNYFYERERFSTQHKPYWRVEAAQIYYTSSEEYEAKALDKDIFSKSSDWIRGIESDKEGTGIKALDEKSWGQFPETLQDRKDDAKLLKNSEKITQNLNEFINNSEAEPQAFDVSNNKSQPQSVSYPHSSKRNRQGYAIIVGIDEYDDKSGLHSCVNDARSVADLMNDLGYRVILLSDSSDRKPTKDNILDAAVKDMILKNDMGNIIFYFSGHGIKDDNNTFYLIPQDANGDRSTYISEYEFKRYISDLHNLAIILDVCNGAGMGDSVSSGQVMIASSEEDEPSNEEWTGSLSVFTQNLIDAIQAEKLRSNKILLQSCFKRAFNETVHWSKDHFISQTPVLIDRTGGTYYLK